MSQARFSVRTAVAEGFEFWRANVARVIGPLIIAAAAILALATTSPPNFLTAGAPVSPSAVAIMAIYGLAYVMIQGGLYGVAMADHGGAAAGPLGPLGLQWRGLETRILGASLLVGLVFLAAAVVTTFGVSIGLLLLLGPTGAATSEQWMAGLSPTDKAVFYLGLGLCLVILWWLATRLSMTLAATAADNQIRLWAPFKLTRGAVLPLTLAGLAIYLPVLMLHILAWTFTRITGSSDLAPWTSGISSAVSIFLYQPISVGMTSYIYRRLRGGAGQ
ncbi:MAG: hypothetical protein WC068_14015 [Caulobacter sp.]